VPFDVGQEYVYTYIYHMAYSTCQLPRTTSSQHSKVYITQIYYTFFLLKGQLSFVALLAHQVYMFYSLPALHMYKICILRVTSRTRNRALESKRDADWYGSAHPSKQHGADLFGFYSNQETIYTNSRSSSLDVSSLQMATRYRLMVYTEQ